MADQEKAALKEGAIAEGLRFVFPGVIAYCYLYVLAPDAARQFASAAGTIGFPLALAVVGSGIYFVYRPLFYDWLIRLWQDWVAGKRGNYRTELMNEFGIDSAQAAELWREIKERELSGRYAERRIQAAGIHMCYLAALIAIPFLVAAVVFQRPLVAGVLGGIIVASFLAAFLNDAAFERGERVMLLALGIQKRAKIASRLGYKRPDLPQATATTPAPATPTAAPDSRPSIARPDSP